MAPKLPKRVFPGLVSVFPLLAVVKNALTNQSEGTKHGWNGDHHTTPPSFFNEKTLSDTYCSV